MYNCTKLHTGSAVARVTKNRTARPHLPLTVENQLGRRRQRRQLLTIGQWNVRTLLDREGANRPERRTALVAMELAKYNIDIAALCESRFSESGSLNDLEYSFFWSGKSEGERREARVGFAIKKDIITRLTEMPWPVNDRIMMMRLPLSKDNFATIISVYAPTMTNPDENKEAFYNQLASVLSGIPHTDKVLLIQSSVGDFNARIGRDNDKWPLVMGKHGIGKCNSNGELLLALCSEFELTVTNTMFKQKDECKTTWMHPRSKHWHMIGFIIMRCRDKMDIHSTRAMRGANCWTDHQMLRWKVAFRIRQKHNRQGTNKPTKLNIAQLSTTSHRESFEQEMDSALAQWEEKENSTPDEEWAALQQVVYNTAKTYLGKPDRKKTRTGSTPTTRSYRLLWVEETKPTRECCKPGALDPPQQHTKMHADCYKNTPVHWSRTGGKGRQWSCRELVTETTWRASTVAWRKCGDPRRKDLFN